MKQSNWSTASRVILMTALILIVCTLWMALRH
jgi:hypothetical protein